MKQKSSVYCFITVMAISLSACPGKEEAVYPAELTCRTQQTYGESHVAHCITGVHFARAAAEPLGTFSSMADAHAAFLSAQFRCNQNFAATRDHALVACISGVNHYAQAIMLSE